MGESMNIVFRADSSTQIGSGHIIRCLALAEALKKRGATVAFISREFVGNLCTFVEEHGYLVYRLPSYTSSYELDWVRENWHIDSEEVQSIIKKMNKSINWLIVDHYSLDRKWEERLSFAVENIMVIDDLANRAHSCTVLLDQNQYDNMKEKYGPLLPSGCKLFLGPNFALLRSEFREEKKRLRRREGRIGRILIFYGGADYTNETNKALEAMKFLDNEAIIKTVVVGASNPWKRDIEQMCRGIANTDYLCQVSNMARLINEADFSLGAGGTSVWERCYLGLPSMVTITAENQQESVGYMASMGAVINMGWFTSVTALRIAEVLLKFINNSDEVLGIATKSLELMSNDGNMEAILDTLMREG